MATKGVNKVILIGNLGQDPEMRYTPNGKAIATMNLATSESWTDRQSGQKKEKTEWHRVVIFDKLAEIAGQYLKKGSQVYIEGQLQTRKWTDQAGVERYITEIVVNVGGTMQMLGGATGNATPQSSAQQGHQQRAHQQAQRPQQGNPPGPGQFGDMDDDIPFSPIGLSYGKSRIYAM